MHNGTIMLRTLGFLGFLLDLFVFLCFYLIMKSLKKLFSPFDLCYFDADIVGKREYLTSYIDKSAILSGRGAIDELIESSSLDLSDFSIGFCKRVFQSVGSLWFLLPTSTGGKYHGGPSSLENCIGGNIVHTSRVCSMVPKVLNRYRELLNSTGVEFVNYREVLTVACLLHDIGKAGEKGDEVYSSTNHGEIGAEIISSCWSKGRFADSLPSEFSFFISELVFAVQEHMYMWRGINYLEKARLSYSLTPSIICSIMLCECDYYSF